MNFQQQVYSSLAGPLIILVLIIVLLAIVISRIINYSSIVSMLHKKIEDMEDQISAVHSPMIVAPAENPKAALAAEVGIPAEVVAAISAAVYMMYGSSAGTVTRIRRAAQPNRSAWGMAGLLENTRPF